MTTKEKRIYYGTNPIAWSNDDDQSLGADISLDQCLSDANEIGFDGIEKGHKMPVEADALARVLRPYKLNFISGWHSLNLLKHSVEDEKKAIQPHLDLLKSMESKVCIVCETSNAIHGDDNKAINDKPVLTDAEWKTFGNSIEEVAQYCEDQGITLVYHHHMGTVVESPDEIDRLMDVTGPATKLLFDTGHCHFSGGNTVDMLSKYVDRVAHVHLKNVRQPVMDQVRREGLSFLEGVRRGVFTVPGDPEGEIKFSPLLEILAKNNYTGWLVIEAEQDPDQRNPFEYQSLGLKTLKKLAFETGLDVN